MILDRYQILSDHNSFNPKAAPYLLSLVHNSREEDMISRLNHPQARELSADGCFSLTARPCEEPRNDVLVLASSVKYLYCDPDEF